MQNKNSSFQFLFLNIYKFILPVFKYCFYINKLGHQIVIKKKNNYICYTPKIRLSTIFYFIDQQTILFVTQSAIPTLPLNHSIAFTFLLSLQISKHGSIMQFWRVNCFSIDKHI